jgi:hypothetical protein
MVRMLLNLPLNVSPCGYKFPFVPQQPRSMPAAGFEHTFPAIRCLQIDFWDHTTTEIIDVSYYNIFIRNWLVPTHFVYLFMVYWITLPVAYLYIENETRVLNGEMQRNWKHSWRNLGYCPSICIYRRREITVQQISDGIASVEADVWTWSFSVRWRIATLFTAAFRATCWK